VPVHEGHAAEIDQHARDVGRLDVSELAIELRRRCEIESSVELDRDASRVCEQVDRQSAREAAERGLGIRPEIQLPMSI
jgi:hypothetical protein